MPKKPSGKVPSRESKRLRGSDAEELELPPPRRRTPKKKTPGQASSGDDNNNNDNAPENHNMNNNQRPGASPAAENRSQAPETRGESISEMPNRWQQIANLIVLGLLVMFIFTVLDCNLIMAHKPHRCPKPDKTTCPGDNSIPVIVPGSETKSEPLPVFHDLTALYRSWATFSTWKPFDSSVISSHRDDDIDVEAVFSKLIELGDVYDLTTDTFSKTLQGDQRRLLPQAYVHNLTTQTQVDLVQLERQVVLSLQGLHDIFKLSAQAPLGWIEPVERRLLQLIQRTESEMKQDTRFQRGSKGLSIGSPRAVLSPHLKQVEHIQYLKDTAQRQYGGTGSLEQIAAGPFEDGQLHEIMRHLVDAQRNMEMLSRIMAHSSTEYLHDSSRDLKSVWGMFDLFTAPYGDDDPLRKAVRQSEVLKEISEEREFIHHKNEQIGSLVDSLTRIIDCERAIDRHIDVLEKTSADKSTKPLSDGYLFYKWDTNNRGWVTLRKKEDATEKRTFRDLGQRECRSLYDFQRGPSEKSHTDLTPSAQSANETVLQFVPAAKYLHSKYRNDKGFVNRIVDFGGLVENSYVTDEGFESAEDW